ncbi:histidine kinase [Massilia sp. PWRC2]|uniref:sensor histidine kinase n=1 Tax=Massilia sp. PWRC2 TaxID=2804626 RepID=UPI003CF2D9C5
MTDILPIDYEARFNAVVSHLPGLVYQFVLEADGAVHFPYLSEGCEALLGVTAAVLEREPERFLALILADDRAAYQASMRASAAALSPWNWEGRIWVAAFNDIKWINLRSTPCALDTGYGGGAVQWEGIMTNISAGKHAQHEASDSRAALAELTAHIEAVKEQERTRIAREIHDDLGGNLTAIKMAIAMLARRLPPDQPLLLEKTSYVDSLVDRTIEAVHRISLDLRPPMLDFGIVAALEWQVKEFEKQVGIVCHVDTGEVDIALSPDHAIALFRIFQEALTNIAKHAHASRVDITLALAGTTLSLDIIDNGRGDGVAAADREKAGSFGLRSMSERARALGGTMTLSRAPGGGTMVAIKIELSSPAP